MYKQQHVLERSLVYLLLCTVIRIEDDAGEKE